MLLPASAASGWGCWQVMRRGVWVQFPWDAQAKMPYLEQKGGQCEAPSVHVPWFCLWHSCKSCRVEVCGYTESVEVGDFHGEKKTQSDMIAAIKYLKGNKNQK